MKRIYCISGLGADERIFQKLKIKDAELHALQWIRPENNESISQYAMRFKSQINEENPVILAVSFGGLITINGILLKREPIS